MWTIGFWQVDTYQVSKPAGKHQDGDINVHGIELNNDVKNIDEIRREVGMVFQHFNLFHTYQFLKTVCWRPFGCESPRAEAEEIAMHFLTRVKIPEQAPKYPGQLSGDSSSVCIGAHCMHHN